MLLVFASLPSRRTLARSNDYVAEAARRHRLPALLFTDPQWPAEELGRRLEAGGFVGAKVYLSFAPEAIPREDIHIFDFAPPHQLAELDRRRGILMLHLPRPGRLADAENLAQLEAIDERFPNLQTIVAHVGRAYCPEDVGDGLARLARTRHLRVDISANTNEWVFARLLEAVGPQRVLFGTDLPILRMRMRRVCEDGRYVNLVPPGRYGDLANDPHMREVGPAEAEELTLFLYEELLAFRRAAEAVGLSRRELEAVFHHNAAAVLERAGYTGAARPE
jgi:predicted TIM-barrel fold metal-dependent hydrolase